MENNVNVACVQLNWNGSRIRCDARHNAQTTKTMDLETCYFNCNVRVHYTFSCNFFFYFVDKSFVTFSGHADSKHTKKTRFQTQHTFIVDRQYMIPSQLIYNLHLFVIWSNAPPSATVSSPTKLDMSIFCLVMLCKPASSTYITISSILKASSLHFCQKCDQL